MDNNVKASFKGIIPFIVFLGIYLGTGIGLHLNGTEMAFYQLPSPVASFAGILVAFIIFSGSLKDKMHIFLKGCGDENIITMCIIYLLAGAFATVASAMGGVEATVNLGLTFIPPQFIGVGIFIIAGFISTATGTSVGAIVSVGPIAIGLAEKSGVHLPLVLGALIGGAIFGDNLSVISDTTIAATRTQGVEMRDKFRVNIAIALPAAIVTIILILIFGAPESASTVELSSYNIIKVLPYILVLGLSLAGLNVFLVLTSGIIASGIVGLIYGDFSLLGFSQNIYKGFTGMNEIFILSLLTGGLAALAINAGGIHWILDNVKKLIKGPKTAQLGMGALVSIADIAVANNTVAIILNGSIAKEISKEYKVDPRRTSTILDIFSCVWQGLIPYGAQMLILLKFTEGAVDFTMIFPYLWYQGLLFIVAIASIFIPFADSYIKKHPWNWETK